MTLGVDLGRPRWMCDVLAPGCYTWLPFQGLQWGGEVEGVSPAGGTEMQRLGRRKGTTKVIRLHGKYLKWQIYLACEVSYKGEVALWLFVSYCFSYLQFHPLLCPFSCTCFVLLPPAVCFSIRSLLCCLLTYLRVIFVVCLISLTSLVFCF